MNQFLISDRFYVQTQCLPFLLFYTYAIFFMWVLLRYIIKIYQKFFQSSLFIDNVQFVCIYIMYINFFGPTATLMNLKIRQTSRLFLLHLSSISDINYAYLRIEWQKNHVFQTLHMLLKFLKGNWKKMAWFRWDIIFRKQVKPFLPVNCELSLSFLKSFWCMLLNLQNSFLVVIPQ